MLNKSSRHSIAMTWMQSWNSSRRFCRQILLFCRSFPSKPKQNKTFDFSSPVLIHEKVIRRPVTHRFLGLLFPIDVYCTGNLFQNPQYCNGSGSPGFECFVQHSAFCFYSIGHFLFLILFFIIP